MARNVYLFLGYCRGVSMLLDWLKSRFICCCLNLGKSVYLIFLNNLSCSVSVAVDTYLDIAESTLSFNCWSKNRFKSDCWGLQFLSNSSNSDAIVCKSLTNVEVAIVCPVSKSCTVRVNSSLEWSTWIVMLSWDRDPSADFQISIKRRWNEPE